MAERECAVKPARVVQFALLLVSVSSFVASQDFRKFTFNVGGGVGIPVSDTADLAKVSGNAVVGGGVNFSPHIGFTGEFMWHGLPPSDQVLNAVIAPDGDARLYSLTGNFIFRVKPQGKMGAYVIAGGGWYHRSWELTAPVLVPGTVCGPTFTWWGVACVNGLVPADAVLRDGSSNGGGFNVGGGITLGHEGSGPKFYTEVRYHHAYLNRVDAQVLPVTFGIRW
jgi:hypothetical protein